MANKRIKILVIDDLQDNLITLNALIKDAFPEAIALNALNGKTGLELAAKEDPDVILLDIIMPGLDGYEVCQKLKADKILCEIPVVFVTAIENTREALVQALECGGEAFLSKPIDEIELTAQIRAMLKIREANNAKKDEKVRLENLVEERSKELLQELDAHNKTLENLKVKEAEKSTILQIAINGFWILDNQGKFIEVNDAACKMIGYSKAEMLKMSIPDIEAEETANETANHIKTIIKEGSARFESKHRTKNGNIIDVEISTTWMDSQNIFFAFLNDITERKQAEEALKESEERFRLLFDRAPLGYQSLDINGHFIEINQTWLDTLGYTREEVIGKWFGDFMTPNSQENVKKRFPDFVKNGKVHTEFELIHKNGNILIISFDGRIGNDLKGNFKQTHCVLNDITERKQAEQLVTETKLFYEAIIEGVQDGIWVTDEKDVIVFANKEMEEIAGIPRDQIQGNNVIQDFSKETTGELIEYYVKAKKDKKPTWYNIKVKTPAGKDTWQNGWLIPKYQDSKFTGIICTIRDVTEQQIAITKLKKSDERFEHAMNASYDGLFDWDLNTNAIYYSPSWKKIIGYEDHELPNDFSVWEKTTDPEDVKKSWELQQKLISKQVDRFMLEFKMKHKGGHWVDVLSRAKAIFDDNGKAIRIIGTHTDITERKQAEHELIESKEKIEESESKFKAYTEQSAIAIYLTDLSGDCVYVNSKWLEYSGMTFNEAMGKGWVNGLFEEDKTKITENWYKSVKSGGKWVFEYRFVNKKGEIIWVEGTAKELFNSKGDLFGYLGTNVNITERKKAEKELAKHREHLEELVNERTNELEIKNSELERLNLLFVGREFRIKELRDKIKDLEGKLKP